MGSRRYAALCRKRGDEVTAMISLESLGCFSDAPGSQRYPAPFGALYPSTGDFVAFVGDVGHRDLVARCIETFRRHADVASQGGALPGFLPGIGWSDHWAFWQEGFPALMVTDTAVFRDATYHTALDLPAHLDYERMAKVVEGLIPVVEDLAGGSLH
jgi:hypothetical protein